MNGSIFRVMCVGAGPISNTLKVFDTFDDAFAYFSKLKSKGNFDSLFLTRTTHTTVVLEVARSGDCD